MARIHQPAQDFLVIAVGEQRTVGAGGDAAHEGRQQAGEPHRHRFGADRAARFRVHERAAAGREDKRIAGEQAADHAALAGAELAFAVAVEQLADAAPGGKLDLGIGVAERQAEAGRQASADRGLAGAHQPDQHDAATGQRGRQRARIVQRLGGCHEVACHGGGG